MKGNSPILTTEAHSDAEAVELSEVEVIKDKSNFLRGTIAESLVDGTDSFNDDDKQLIKFHGIYQQKNRDKEDNGGLRLTGKLPIGKNMFMVRGRIPGGLLTSQQYLAWDHIAERFGGGSLRLTTRQSVQLHGLLKEDLKTIMQEIHSVGLTTTGACGDVVRNITAALNIDGNPLYDQLHATARQFSTYFASEAGAYLEIWLDDTQYSMSDSVSEKRESIFGKTYLPRKFKIGLCLAGENGIDLYANDLGFAATFAPAQNGENQIDGFFVFVGGGGGMTHNKPETFPRAADLLGWIPAASLFSVATAVVTAHRDLGDRSNRRHARLKYVLADRGVDWFRAEIEKRANMQFDTARALPAWKVPDYHGFIKKPNGKYNFGLYIMNGRIKDMPGHRLKAAIQMAVARTGASVQFTPDQDILFLDLDENQREELVSTFKAYGINTDRPNELYRRALSCVSLPTCALALTESERSFPHVMRDINRLAEKHNVLDRAPLVRMTGCPNGCARPYSSEIGIVGQQNGGKYAIFLGGKYDGTTVGTAVLQKVQMNELPAHLDKLFAYWVAESHPQERLGDFIARVGLDAIRALF